MIKVLHVDEDSLELALTRIDMAQISDDIDIDWATSATEALGALNEDDYDCIISEYYMRDMHGLNMLQELRNLGNSIPVIFFSKLRPTSGILEAQEAGASDFLVKGQGYSQYKELLKSIRKAVKKLQKSRKDFVRQLDEAMYSSKGNEKKLPKIK